MITAHIGDVGRAEVRMKDANGNPTDRYDVAGGIAYTSSDPAKIAVVDEDAEPRDAQVEFLALTNAGIPAFIEVRFDGDTGEGVREIVLRSDDIEIVPGDAVAGEIVITFSPVA